VIKNILENSIKTALWSLKIDEKKVSKINLEHPEELSHGDYSCNIAMILAKQVAQNPRELAEKIVAEINERKPEEISRVEVAGPGFINFYLSSEFFVNESKEILCDCNDFGRSKIGEGKKVVVEYSSPNIAKPFTIGHLRSTVIGDAIANILDYSGYKVIRDNHLGDWGTQFGKLIVAIKTWSSLDKIKKSKQPIKDLVDLYVKFHDEAEKDLALDNEARDWFTKLEKNNKEAKNIWNVCVKLSMKEFEKIYKRLGVKFDTAYGESYFEKKMQEVLKDINKLNLAKESEGAYLVFFKDDKYPPMMLLKKDGSTIYALRDLATDKFRKEKYGKDVVIINEVGMEQSLHFEQIFETERLLGYSNGADRIHVKHGFYRFPEGKMSTRKGNGIWLDEVLDEAVVKAAAFDKNTAEVVGIGAIKFNDLKRESSKDIIFNWDEILNLKGDSGPYLQYSYARAKSILRKAKEDGVKAKVNPSQMKSQFDGASITILEKLLYRFPEVVERAGAEYSPHYIATYLIELASSFNNFYGQGKIVDKTDANSPYKVALTEAFSIVLKNGLNLLGISAPEKM
jgi:arginyl-tRNA synthetase